MPFLTVTTVSLIITDGLPGSSDPPFLNFAPPSDQLRPCCSSTLCHGALASGFGRAQQRSVGLLHSDRPPAVISANSTEEGNAHRGGADRGA